MKPAAINIRSIRLANLAMEDALNAIDAALATRVPTRIAFVNADCVNIAARNDRYRQDLESMDWVFVDGIGMKIAGKLLDQPVRANVNGTDLFPLVCEELARGGRRIFLLGAKPGVADVVARWAQDQYPGLVIAGAHHGYFSEQETPAIVSKIRDAGTEVLFVAMGAPRQEAWINRHMKETGVNIALGVGGLFDYYSGNVPRAPMWMRNCGFEWLFRLVQEPRRLWKRYIVGNGAFLARIMGDKAVMTISKKDP
jgi:N-acetylglucosaminyldiphosphoundecaprenol N-acetyl-beta-D-mannosaminyltransferase